MKIISDDKGVKTLYVDASVGGPQGVSTQPRVYIRLDTGARVDVSDTDAETSTDWDLALKRPVIYTNGGEAGSGQGKAGYVDKGFDSVTAADEASSRSFVEDFLDDDCNPILDRIENPNTTFADWYDYNEQTHVLTPGAHVYLVRGGTGKLYKLQILSFYTNPDGVAAKRTTMWVMILIGIFYVFPPVFGVIGRNLMPQLYSGSGVTGTDGIVLKLPTILREKYGVLGSILSGVTCAGAFAAFMSTFSGLLVSMTGAVAHDVYGRILRPNSSPAQRMAMFKISAAVVGTIAILLGTLVENFEINFMVGQAFAIAAASYFPLLFMSVWWRGMTMKGAATGMLTGGLLALIGISLTSWTTFITAQGAKFKSLNMPEPGWFQALKGVSLADFWAAHPLLRILCEQPAIWAVPMAMLLMVVVSKLTKKDIPSDVRMKMLVLHAPEQLGLKQEYIQDHHAAH